MPADNLVLWKTLSIDVKSSPEIAEHSSTINDLTALYIFCYRHNASSVQVVQTSNVSYWPI